MTNLSMYAAYIRNIDMKIEMDNMVPFRFLMISLVLHPYKDSHYYSQTSVHIYSLSSDNNNTHII